MNDKNKKRCPVCGKYATSAMVEKYEKLVSDKAMLEKKLNVKEGLVNSLKGEIAKQAEEIAALREAKNDLLAKNEQLLNRGFFARLFNVKH